MTASQKMNPRLKILIPVVRGLAKILGKDYEVNLHDVSMPEHSLVLCENGYVTGRYLAKNNRGELIKCSCIFIRDENEKIIAFLCINYDLKKAVAAQELIESLVKVDMGKIEQYPESFDPPSEPHGKFPEPVRESFAQDLEEVMDDSLAQAKRRIGKPLQYLTKPEKKQVIKELHDKGFFLLKGAVDTLAAEMGNTKFTIYAYIRDIQKKQ